MPTTQKTSHDHTSPNPHKATGFMHVEVIALSGNRILLNIHQIHRDMGGTRITGNATENGIRYTVSFTMSEEFLPAGQYDFPGDRIRDIHYMVVIPGQPEWVYPARRAHLVIYENTPAPFISGDLIFETQAVGGEEYRVEIRPFEVRGKD
ncbi:hypothetical protein [Pseudomonas vanderleydeniana]|uniref:Uncharacterized protein n=1 Tax=Pseudomonas vanderleydeniana TaxID=2745495 RepID=A0A9E6PGF4_9PSED|nr:hypothetical protein [Pseudomonas vanderleydeniana]QXI25925.1 hypothetical protein HU752_018335 [Pseudomonas vanderleydeniana]